jgi:hypothetical protein
MFNWIKRVRFTQPPTPKTKVIELEIGGRIGRFMWNHNWGAMTVPWPFITTIFYWSADPQPDGAVNQFIRVHEFVHVKQNEPDLFFGVSWVRYMWASIRNFSFKTWRADGLSAALLAAYHANKFELEAYAVEDGTGQHGLPDWAKE